MPIKPIGNAGVGPLNPIGGASPVPLKPIESATTHIVGSNKEPYINKK